MRRGGSKSHVSTVVDTHNELSRKNSNVGNLHDENAVRGQCGEVLNLSVVDGGIAKICVKCKVVRIQFQSYQSGLQ